MLGGTACRAAVDFQKAIEAIGKVAETQHEGIAEAGRALG